MGKHIHLEAIDLLSKHGFYDGDIIFDLCADELEEAGASIMGTQDVLVALVKTYLIPLLPSNVEVYEISSIHNPIRVRYEEEARDEHVVTDYDLVWALLDGISVDIPIEEVIRVALELQRR